MLHHARLCIPLAIVVSLASCGPSGGGGGSLAGRVLLGGALIGATVAFAGVRGPSGGQPVNKAEPDDQIKDPRHSGVAACVRGNAEANLQIARAFEESMHELVVCGGMAQRFSISFFNTLINLARGKKTSPRGFKHIGGGRYQVGDVMFVSLALPFATSFGAENDAIPFDVFDGASYFADASVHIQTRTGARGELEADLAVRFRERRPGLELLGDLIPLEGFQLRLDFDAVVKMLGAVKLRQEISVDDRRGPSTVQYQAVSDGVPMRNLVFAAGGGAPIAVTSARVVNPSLGQTLTVTNWGMVFSGGSAKTMDGFVEFEVRGGDFDWAGKFVYPHRPTPDITLSCL